MSWDGRDPKHKKWINQNVYNVGFHYNMAFEHAHQINQLLEKYKQKDDHLPRMVEYPDCRTVVING
jgi:hypothetical protein